MLVLGKPPPSPSTGVVCFQIHISLKSVTVQRWLSYSSKSSHAIRGVMAGLRACSATQSTQYPWKLV